MRVKQFLKGQIFISYRRADAERVVAIVAELKRRKFNVWYDDALRQDFGGDYQSNLQRAIVNSHAVIAVISPTYPDSEYCKWEIEQAKSQNIRIFPAVIEVGDEELYGLLGRASLSEKQAIDLFSTKELENLSLLAKQLPRPLSYKLQWMALAIVVLLVAIVGVFAVMASLPPPALNPIDVQQFQFPDSSSPPQIHDMIQSDDGLFWLATQFGDDDNRIYSFDPTDAANTLQLRWQRMGADVYLSTLHLDCAGTLWVGQEVFTLDNEDIGLLGFDTSQTDLSNPVIFNPSVNEDWGLRYSLVSITSRCQSNGQVDVWVADSGHGIRHLQYSTLSNITVKTAFFEENPNIRLIEYMPAFDELWIAIAEFDHLIIHNADTNSVTRRDIADIYDGDALLTFAHNSDHTIWTALNGDLLNITTDPIVIVSNPSLKGQLATSLAFAGDLVWYGSRCEADESDCQNLFKIAYKKQNISPVGERIGLSEQERVNKLISIESNNMMWVATNGGLFYANSANE